MKIQYVGTAAAEAIPALFCHCEKCKEARKLGGRNIRGRSGAVINDHLLIDFPPDIYFQSLKFGVDLGAVKSLIVTHSHLDHFAVGELMMRDLDCFAHLPDGSESLTIYGSGDVQAELFRATQREFDVTEKKFFEFNRVKPFEPFITEGVQFTPIKASHGFQHHLECYIYIVESEGKRVFYCNDTGFLPEEDWGYIKGIHFDAVSFDCCCVLQKDGTSHMGIPDNIEMRKKLVEYGCADSNTRFVITHFSHNCILPHDELESIAAKEGFITAYDGMELVL